MFEKKFLLDTVERLVRTFIQTFAAFLVVQGGFSSEALYGALVAGGLAIATAVAALKWPGSDDNASFLVKEQTGDE